MQQSLLENPNPSIRHTAAKKKKNFPKSAEIHDQTPTTWLEPPTAYCLLSVLLLYIAQNTRPQLSEYICATAVLNDQIYFIDKFRFFFFFAAGEGNYWSFRAVAPCLSPFQPAKGTKPKTRDLSSPGGLTTPQRSAHSHTALVEKKRTPHHRCPTGSLATLTTCPNTRNKHTTAVFSCLCLPHHSLRAFTIYSSVLVFSTP